MQTLERVDQLSLIAASPMGKSIPDILDADKLQSVAIFLFRIPPQDIRRHERV